MLEFSNAIPNHLYLTLPRRIANFRQAFVSWGIHFESIWIYAYFQYSTWLIHAANVVFNTAKRLKVAPRAEKTEVFRKGWNFANRTHFAGCIMKKHYFLLWTKKTAFFPYFYHGVVFYSAELFDCAVNFKFYTNIFIF